MMLTVLAVMFAMPMGAQTPATAPTCKVTGTVMDKETGEPEMMAPYAWHTSRCRAPA